MINYFIEAWDKYKSNLKEYFETHRQEDFANDYESILKVVVDNVINKREEVQETEIFLDDWLGSPLKDYLDKRDVETKKCELYNNKDIYFNCEKQRTIVC